MGKTMKRVKTAILYVPTRNSIVELTEIGFATVGYNGKHSKFYWLTVAEMIKTAKRYGVVVLETN